MVGQPEAAVTVPPVGGGVVVPVPGVVLVIVTLPPVPGDEMSSAPQPARARAPTLASMRFLNGVTGGPSFSAVTASKSACEANS